MTTKITFENAQLADALGKAARIAPVKGAAFDKAAGFHMTVNPTTKLMTLRATNLETSYFQTVPAVDGSGDEVAWRLPSGLLSSLVSNLPMSGSDSQITFVDRGDSYIRLIAGSVKAKLNTLSPGDFPKVEPFDAGAFKEANEFAAKVDQVAWACDKKSTILSGVHIDGERLVGCNHQLLALVPCATSVENPITVPLFTLAPILKSATDVSIGSEAKRMLISLDAETQATSQLVEGEYPKYQGIMRDNFLGSFKVRKDALVEAMTRMLSMFRNERMPTMKVDFDGSGIMKMIVIDMDVADTGRMQDTIPCIEGDFEDVCSLNITPQMLMDAVSHSNAETVTIQFGHEDPDKSWRLPVRVSDDRGYECYVMPKKA